MKLLPLLTLLSACSGDAEPTREEWEAIRVEGLAQSECRGKLSKELYKAGAFDVDYKEIDALCANAQTRTSNLMDSDGDGYSNVIDCDVELAEVNPATIEKCDGLDNNCNGKVDEDPRGLYLFEDFDGDKYGDPSKPATLCNYMGQSRNLVDNNDDCDDTRPDVHPGAKESFQNGSALDGIDNDCDKNVDIYDGKKAPKGLRGIKQWVGESDFIPENSRCIWTEGKIYYPGQKPYFSIFNEENGYSSGSYQQERYEEVLKRCGEAVNIPWEEIILDAQEAGESAAKDDSIVSFTASLDEYFGEDNTLWSKQAPHVLTPTQMDFIYAWALPVMLEKWNTDLNNEEKRKMLSQLHYAKTYVRTEFKYQEELDYYRALEGMNCGTEEKPEDCTDYFTAYGPNDPWRLAIAQSKKCAAMLGIDEAAWEAKDDCYDRVPKSRRAERYIETAVFRRVNNGELTPGTMSHWFGRVEKDLKKGFTYTPEATVETERKAQ